MRLHDSPEFCQSISPPEGDGALCTSHFFLFDVRHDRMEPRYLQAIFRANYLQDQLVEAIDEGKELT